MRLLKSLILGNTNINAIKNYKLIILTVFILMIIHLVLLIFCARINLYRGVPLDEARYIPAGLFHWQSGEFALANDTPPLARMVAVLPLLPLGVKTGGHDLHDHDAGVGMDLRDRELEIGGRFASIIGNPRWFMLFCLARMTGYFWWLLGAWVIFRWSGELYGGRARYLGVALWCLVPNVLAHEHRATPELPLAVIFAAATYAFRGYIVAPSWRRSLMAGFLLGVAQLIDFVALTFFIIWPLLALVHRLTSGIGILTILRLRTRILHLTSSLALCLWVINLGYGFEGSGSPLGGFDFASGILKGLPQSSRVGNRLRGTWLGHAVCPVPTEYMRGLDRRLHEREAALDRRGNEDWSVGAEYRSIVASAGKVPVGLGAMMLGSLVLVMGRRSSRDLWAEEMTLWLPVVAILALTTYAFGPVPPSLGILMATPFGIIISSKVSNALQSGRRGSIWIAAALSIWAIGDSLNTLCCYQFTPEHVARLGQDVDHLMQKLGLPVPKQRFISDIDTENRGRLYGTFMDSQGDKSNYMLFVPRDYHGDQPYPLILFLHGYGDAGTAGRQFTTVGLPFTLAYREVNFLVLCPQSRSGNWDISGDDARRTMELLAEVQKRYQIDPKRIYLTGLSSGGTGVWELAAQFPDRWAAIVPVAAASCDPNKATLIRHIPCWCFHNRYDGGSPPVTTRKMIGTLRSMGGNPRYTEFIDVTHNAWDRAYSMPQLYDWLGRHHKKSRLAGPD